jgi:hypothetical protein
LLELNVSGALPVTLHYFSSQEYDLVVRADTGRIVWQWSDARTFLAALHDDTTFGRNWSVDVPLTDRAGASLPPGRYQLEAWITSGVDRPPFAATAPFEIPEKTER